MSPEHRAVVAADRVLEDPGRGALHVEMAISAALTDYRSAFARKLISAGVPARVVWDAIRDLRIDRRMPAELVAPLAPEVGG